MSYKPWPDEGCTLAEARERTADREPWNPLRDRAQGRQAARQRRRPKSDPGELQNKIDAAFFSLLQTQRLIAYGCKTNRDAAPQPIPASLWPTLKPDWEASTAVEDRLDGIIFHSVQVFPVLKAPYRVDLLAGKSLAEAFRFLVLDDPEVAVMAKAAIECAPQFENVFVEGRCTVAGCREWRLSMRRPGADDRTEEQSAIGILAKPLPAPVIDAREALTDRFAALLEVLRKGDLLGRGAASDSSALVVIPRTVWSHDHYWLDAARGDILQLNPDCEDPPRDFLRRRWLAVWLESPNTDARASIADASSQAKPVSRTIMSAFPTTAPFSPADIVAAGSLGAALDQLVFQHPVIEDLRTKARVACEQRSSFYEDAGLLTPCFGHDGPFLPIKHTISDHDRLTPEELESIEHLLPDEPVEVRHFYRMVNERLCHLFDALRQGKVIAIAHTVRGEPVPLNHTIWSHEEYYILPRTSDIFEARPMKMIKRWVGVIFTNPDLPAPVKPSTPIPSKAATRVQTSAAASTACLAWLTAEMKQSPTVRPRKKDDWWGLAEERWPGRLTRRSFDVAWKQAIDASGAIAWSAAGAPRKPRDKSPHP